MLLLPRSREWVSKWSMPTRARILCTDKEISILRRKLLKRRSRLDRSGQLLQTPAPKAPTSTSTKAIKHLDGGEEGWTAMRSRTQEQACTLQTMPES